MVDDKPAGGLAFPLGVALPLLGCVAIGAWEFGWRFLRQFFISPFQFFILVPWLFAAYALWSGVMPTRSGPSVRRDQDPNAFSMMVRYSILMGAAGFALNFSVSWLVVSRGR